ncbi:TIGR01620 family protein [uncultured Endozoicomonas sp.]|uniref:TIGR01620 family protein n=1 Tax=uncultured Endozoicomonas sp. TaxID=432652 RepID=UPI00261F295F|nr:TIGR01620 family protein [uncultured Endozoicomonas sp.]
MSEEKDPWFIPISTESPIETPDSISATLPEPIEVFPELATRSLRLLKRAVMGVLALVVVLVTWQSIELVQFLYSFHWFPAVLALALLFILSIVTGKAVIEFFLYQRDFKNIAKLQDVSEQVRTQRSQRLKTAWSAELQKLYQNKPQQVVLEQALATMPDYNDDREMLAHLDNHFFQKLDQQALNLISNHSQQVALMVALSPFAALDMLLALWRSIRMLDEICQIYGIRPSLPARLHLIRMVLRQMALAGATDLLSDQLADFTSNRLLGLVSGQVASGLGVGIYTARIGLRALSLCRPLPFKEEQKPGIRRLAKSILSTLEARFKKTSV